MIDQDTQEKFLQAENRAIHDGIPLIEVLDRAGLLVTPEMIKTIARNAIGNLLRELEEFQPVTIASLGGNQTVTGAYEGCLAYIRIYTETMEQK
jgi:hypothetical protein